MNADLYGLNADPFPLPPAAGSYFQSDAHSKALAFVGDHLGKAPGVIAIIGENGAGKSMLADHLLKTIDRHEILTVKIAVDPGPAFSLYHQIAIAFGLATPANEHADWRAVCEQFLQEQACMEAPNKCRILLVIDDAHRLDADDLVSLHDLLKLQLHVLLLGEPELCCHLSSAFAVENEQPAHHQLGHLDPAEVRDFIEHRLLCSGWSGDSPSIDPRVFLEIARASDGLPGRVNLIFHDLWETNIARGSSRIDLPLIRDVLARATSASGDMSPHALSRTDGTAATFAMHEELIGELQKAVVELAELQKRRTYVPERLDHALNSELLPHILDRLSTLEAQALEQEQALKHILTMLIEWIENGNQRAAA